MAAPTSPGGSSSSSQSAPSAFSWEYLVALSALGIVICYADRTNLSTAVLPMAKQFGWDKAYEGMVLSSFFGGYALTQVLGGSLADKYGGKMVLAAGVAIWSFFTACTPQAAAHGTATLLTARVLLGVGEGVAFPSIHSLISRNVPAASQSTAVGLVTAASYGGTALAFGVSPIIISHYGWQFVFYLFSAVALLWLPLWMCVTTRNYYPPGGVRVRKGARAPAAGSKSGCSSKADLETAVAAVATVKWATKDMDAADMAAPLLQKKPQQQQQQRGEGAAAATGFWALMRRREVWAICVAQYAGSWGMYGLLSWLPTFFSDFYGIPISELAGYTFLPYIVQGFTGMASGMLADKLLHCGWQVRTVRTMLQVLGMLGPATCLLLAGSPLVGASASVASSLITVGLGFSALSLGGVSVSHLDIAPRHAGVIFGAGNTAATLAGFISVPATGLILQTTQSWPLVFGITAAHYVVGAVVWAAWVGDKQLPEDLIDEDPGPVGEGEEGWGHWIN